MRLTIDPRLPREGSSGFTASLLLRLNQLFANHANQVNNLTEGRISAVTNAGTAAPTAGRYAKGDFVRNSAPEELGSASSKYVITGWVCTAGGEPGTWKQCRSLTGN